MARTTPAKELKERGRLEASHQARGIKIKPSTRAAIAWKIRMERALFSSSWRVASEVEELMRPPILTQEIAAVKTTPAGQAAEAIKIIFVLKRMVLPLIILRPNYTTNPQQNPRFPVPEKTTAVRP